VQPSGVRPSVCLSRRSTAASACGGFAAERPAGRRYRLIFDGGGRRNNRYNSAAARRSAANAGSAVLTAAFVTLANLRYINALNNKNNKPRDEAEQSFVNKRTS